MSQTTPPTVDPLPAAPSTSSPSTFAALADSFLSALITLRAQLVALATNVYNNALDAYTNAGVAAAGAAAAVAATGVLPWVSGTTYTAGSAGVGASCVSSLINFRTYRRTTNGAGTTDPSLDPTNWSPISWGAFPRLHVREQQATGVNSAASASAGVWSTHIINATLMNTISGASVSANTVILPAGTYECKISCPATNPNGHRARLYDVTAGSALLYGTSEYTGTGTTGSSRSFITERFTLAATHTLRVEHFTQSATYFGTAASTGVTEVYLDAIFEQVGS